ncbi:helix-turn-helix domain-containing protein [Agromyces tropicus]|uniref:Helix-turn-helix domain-containing protein n=1 Tax=Agromyces tropicus TaxID=555371 RepID=A0ABP5GCI7_9MICO
MDAYWRSRAGSPQSRGVLAPRPGEPGVVADAGTAPPSGAVPVRMTRRVPSTSVADLVRHYWIPRWNLPPRRRATQRVLEYPSANLVVEEGAARVHGPSVGLATRRLEGRGQAFGALLQPGVASALTGVEARRLVGTSVPVDDAAAMAKAVDALVARGADAAAAEAFEAWLGARRPVLDEEAGRIREVIAAAERDRAIVRVDQLAEVADVGVRQLERMVRDQLGLTPKWLVRRYRLQESADRLAGPDAPALAELAAELGYADQAHFTREFRAVIGVPPGAYAREAAVARADGPGA